MASFTFRAVDHTGTPLTDLPAELDQVEALPGTPAQTSSGARA
ncbi:MAG: hypothetical protein ACLP1Q_17670 [Solirubrobacteraceae bacterium]|jgi:hypothetical protein